MDPVGVPVADGLFKIIAGLYFKTPLPIQPMKAIGTRAISHPGAIGPGAIWASGLLTGVLWLVMGLTGAVKAHFDHVRTGMVASREAMRRRSSATPRRGRREPRVR